MSRIRTEPRLPRSGDAARAAGALIQAALGAELVLAGPGEVIAPAYTQRFREFIRGSPGANSGPRSPLVQTLVVPNIERFARLARFTGLFAGAVLLACAVEGARRVAGPLGAQHGYEPIVALVGAAAAFALGGLSLTIYLLQGGHLPRVDPNLAFTSPVAVELLLAPVAVGVAWLELGRFLALRSPPPGTARMRSRRG